MGESISQGASGHEVNAGRGHVLEAASAVAPHRCGGSEVVRDGACYPPQICPVLSLIACSVVNTTPTAVLSVTSALQANVHTYLASALACYDSQQK